MIFGQDSDGRVCVALMGEPIFWMVYITKADQHADADKLSSWLDSHRGTKAKKIRGMRKSKKNKWLVDAQQTEMSVTIYKETSGA